MKLFLDSGAFSAKTQGKTISLEDYIWFITKNHSKLDHYVNLDVIGDPVQTWRNQELMEAAGLRPLPVFHSEQAMDTTGKGMEYLDRCLEYDYFCLGGMAGKGVSKTERMKFLDRCWGLIVDSNGYPRSKVHGLGMTSIDFLYRYPWYSVDSTSWVQYGKYGMVLVPPCCHKGQYDYTQSPISLKVSARSPALEIEGKHILTLHKNERNRIEQFFMHKGFRLGKSEILTLERKMYNLQSNERWVGKNKLERVLEAGLCNDLTM